MALIHHYYRDKDGELIHDIHHDYHTPAEFVVTHLADGVPFRCLNKDSVDVKNDIDAMMSNDEFFIVESAGGGVVKAVTSTVSSIINIVPKVFSWLIKTPSAPSMVASSVNNQAKSSNNSLADRTNKPRPGERVWDICGTVQSIPSDLMQSYNIYDENNKQYQYGYYYVARGEVSIDVDKVTDSDTIYSTITGSSAEFYKPHVNPNSGEPYLTIGDAIEEPLYITVRSNSVDGLELKAPNEYKLALTGVTITCELSGTTGALIDETENMSFDDLFSAGQSIELLNVKSGTAALSGTYIVSAVSSQSISFDVSDNLAQWEKISGGSAAMTGNSSAKIQPTNIDTAGFSDWFFITSIKPTRIIGNFLATQGMYKVPTGTNTSKVTSATAEMQWQFLDDDNQPYGDIYSNKETLVDKSRIQVGKTISAEIGVKSKVRVRMRRSSEQDTAYNGTVVDTITWTDLYGQIEEETGDYGDMTTVQTKRKATPQATSIKSPEFRCECTELLYKYMGNGVFDTELTENTQAVQSLIRILRDPLIGGLDLSNSCMDELLEVQDEIETYFGDVLAGQFCYTFDDKGATAQDQANIIASAIFSRIDRQTGEPRLFFERPYNAPSMLFTHRSKIGDEKWTRTFGSVDYDSVEFTWVDPDTNITETIYIPDEDGVNPDKIESKGVRNYQQAYWLAHRAYQKNNLHRVSVEFTATEEGNYAIAGEPISVVKGSRIASYDGFIVAVDNLTLTLSQEVVFTEDDDHYIQLKKRDGTIEVIKVVEGSNQREVIMLSAPTEEIYTGNSAVKTEFSFGNEARHAAQIVVPTQIIPDSQNHSVKITAINYHPDVFLYDSGMIEGAFSNGFSNGYLI